MSVTTPWLILSGLVLAILAFLGGDYKGYENGVAATQAQQAKDDVARLTQTVKDTTAAINASNEVNQQMRTILGQIEKSGQSSTKELKNALAKNHADPVICKFDADSMRIIAEARARAANRAAGGIRDTVPAARGTN